MNDLTSNEWLGSLCDLLRGMSGRRVFIAKGMIFIVFVFLVEVEQEGGEAPSCCMCCSIL